MKLEIAALGGTRSLRRKTKIYGRTVIVSATAPFGADAVSFFAKKHGLETAPQGDIFFTDLLTADSLERLKFSSPERKSVLYLREPELYENIFERSAELLQSLGFADILFIKRSTLERLSGEEDFLSMLSFLRDYFQGDLIVIKPETVVIQENQGDLSEVARNHLTIERLIASLLAGLAEGGRSLPQIIEQEGSKHG